MITQPPAADFPHDGDQTVHLYNPETFDPEAALPDDLKGYADQARWLVHLLYMRRVYDRTRRDEFVRLKAQYLRKYLDFHRYADIIEALAAANVLEVSRRYVVGKHSRGYRLGAGHRGQPHRRVAVASPTLARKLRRDRARAWRDPGDDTHRHLKANLHRVEIDYVAAAGEGAIASPHNHLQASCIRDRHFFFKVDDYGRVHSNLSNLKKTLRRYLHVDSRPLVNVDVANSQPLFVAVMLLEGHAGRAPGHKGPRHGKAEGPREGR